MAGGDPKKVVLGDGTGQDQLASMQTSVDTAATRYTVLAVMP